MKLFKIFLGLFIIFNTQNVLAQIAVLNSETSSATYSSTHLGDYTELWKDVIYTLNHINVKYNIISENDTDNLTKKNYDLLILPLIIDLPQKSLNNIENYTQEGGKIIVIFPDTYTSPVIKKLALISGVEADTPGRALYKTSINWINDDSVTEKDFPASTKIAAINMKSKCDVCPLAFWDEAQLNKPAVTVSDTGSYIGWRWGNDGNLAFNVFAFKSVANSLVPGIIEKEQATLSAKEFENKLNEIDKFRKNTCEFVDSLTQSDSNSTLADIQEGLYLSKVQEDLSKVYYQDNKYLQSQEELNKARISALNAYAKSVPSNMVEGRTLWLDRGTISTLKTQEDVANLFDKIQKIGINLVYFETLNAGYTIYPSRITEQNPLTVGRDPLQWAIIEAHKRNIELHAWTWIFAVGNTKHNPIIGKPYDYPGPILSKNYDLALIGQDGNLLPVNQQEYWLDPANAKARRLVLSILVEIVKNYQVDGVQLDYIRYPFQKTNNLMGFDTEGRRKFELETGCNLDKLDQNTMKLWTNWKKVQVSKFVQEVSYKLRKIRPDIQISAAVFGGERDKRLSSIQQDWETWVDKGWVDILNPMIYSSSTDQLVENLNYLVKATGDKALIYPGIAVRQLESADLLEQIYTIKELGLIGNTIFAMAHLGDEKSDLLSSGPYRFKDAKSPNDKPINSAGELLDEFRCKAMSIKHCSRDESLAYNYSADEVIAEADKAHTYILDISDQPTSENISNAIVMIEKLEYLTQNWLTNAKQLKPSRVKLLNSYLINVKILLSYEQHKKNLRDCIQEPVKNALSKE